MRGLNNVTAMRLDENIRDVALELDDAQKADVLLYALQRLPTLGRRATIESAVASLLQVPGLSPTRPLLLRAKCRLAAGYHTSAQQDLNSVLESDPENQDVEAIVQSQHLHQMQLRELNHSPRFSVEVWREIALFLPRRDLKTLLFVPNALSRIASELLFRDINLHLTSMEPGSRVRFTQGSSADQDINAWHFERSADILARMLVDAQFAHRVRTLGVFAVTNDDMQTLAFQTGMLMNTLPELLNLRKVHVSGKTVFITRILQKVHACNPWLQRLSLAVTGHNVDIQVPVFKQLERFMISSDGGISSSSSIHTFLAESRDSLCSLSIDNPRWHFPTEAISVHQLTQLEFQGCFSPDTQAFSEILANGHQLESLMLWGMLECTPSALFRQHRTALPFLRHFALTITTLPRHITDPDLCPAISDFIRERNQLQTYRLRVPPSDARRIGFDASAWGTLPGLNKLTSLAITYPSSLPPTLAGWLVPRTVRALSLDLLRAGMEDLSTFMTHLRVGMPPHLRYLAIKSKSVCSVKSIVEHGFPHVRIVQINNCVWTVTRSGEEVEAEEWSSRRVKYYSTEWLESLGCTDAIWQGVGHSDHTW